MLALCTGYCRDAINSMKNGVTHKGEGYDDIIKSAYDYIGALEASLASSGAMNSTVYIFRAKNFQGMSDKQEVVVTPNTGMNEPQNVDNVLQNLPTLNAGE